GYTPPPYHGQSMMLQFFLEGFGGDQSGAAPGSATNAFGILCYHVDARMASGLDDIGTIRIRKMVRLLVYIAQTLWFRFRYKIPNFYYLPALSLKGTVM